jgi:hypothetical protein
MMPGVVRPPAILSLLRKLPPPDCFGGPFVSPDALIHELLNREIPAPSVPPVVAAPDAPATDGTAAATARPRKRKHDEEEEEEDEHSASGGVDDLYRQRQRQRVQQLNSNN